MHPPGTDAFDRMCEVAIEYASELFADGRLTTPRFSEVVDAVLRAGDQQRLAAIIAGLPAPVRFTPPEGRLDRPLMLRTPTNQLPLRPGWRLAADTTVASGHGRLELDLGSASWDAPLIELRIETWGIVELLVPWGVAVQIARASVPIEFDDLKAALPGGLVLCLSTSGPAGEVRVKHGPRARHPVRRRARRLALAGKR